MFTRSQVLPQLSSIPRFGVVSRISLGSLLRPLTGSLLNESATERSASCSKCKCYIMHFNCIYWTKCNHFYCPHCAMKMINDALSIHNQVPKCIDPNCGEPLGIKEADSLFTRWTGLLPRYRIGREMRIVSNLKKQDLLFVGYIRIESENSHFPDDITGIIFNFLRLMIYKKIECNVCDGKGYEACACKRCGQRGYLLDCTACNSTGKCMIRNVCIKCCGTGAEDSSYLCRGCSGTGIYAAPCRWCYGTGIDSDGYTSCRCVGCQGTGEYRTPCQQCDGSGIYMHRGHCDICNGSGETFRRAPCRQCNGSGSQKRVCTECDGHKIAEYPCAECQGEREVMALDLKTLCDKQSLCVKCGKYTRNDLIRYWSGCKHTVCGECGEGHIEFELKLQQRIPQCPVKGCGHQLEQLDASHPCFSDFKRLSFVKPKWIDEPKDLLSELLNLFNK